MASRKAPSSYGMKKMSDFFSVKPKKPSATASTTEVQLESEATPRAAASTDRQKKVRRTLEGTVTSSRRTEGGTNSDAVGNHHGDIELARRKVSTAEETKLKRGYQRHITTEKLVSDVKKEIGKAAQLTPPTEPSSTTRNEARKRGTSLAAVTPKRARTESDSANMKVSPESFGALETPNKFTPLEQQFIDIKSQYPDALLAVEVGYKYKFFGHDADIAAQHLDIISFRAKSFMNASIPTHRLFVHVRRLVEAGFKVGVVNQTETAALKHVGDNKSAPFTRKLSRLYTKSSLIGEELDSGHEASIDSNAGGINFLCCFLEEERANVVDFTMVAVSLGTGEIIYDVFEDGPERSALVTRLAHLSPTEILVGSNSTRRTMTLMQQVCSSGLNPPRLECLPPSMFQLPSEGSALLRVTRSCCITGAESPLLQLAPTVQRTLEAIVSHLVDFGLEKVLGLLDNARSFSSKDAEMSLNASTIKSLELFTNETDHTSKGSLFWVLDRTSTSFGSRLLRRWLSRPLADPVLIEARLDAVATLAGPAADTFSAFRAILRKSPDLERSVTNIFYGKCSASDFTSTLLALQAVHGYIVQHRDTIRSCCTGSALILEKIDVITDGLASVSGMLQTLDLEAAHRNDKIHLFVNDAGLDEVKEQKAQITAIERKLSQELTTARIVLGIPGLNYITVSGDSYLLEVTNASIASKKVPTNWEVISKTQKVTRYRSPEVISLLKSLAQHTEQLTAEASAAWLAFLSKAADNYDVFRAAVESVATLDVLIGFSELSTQEYFNRPKVLLRNDATSTVHITGGRNPIVSALINSSGGDFVPNDVSLSNSEDGERCYIVTGPNMGGKSCYIRQVALVSIMTQVGSFVPAVSAELTPLDAIFTRMGAEDNIFTCESTFMHELSEASEILRRATPRSLVIMDELGRGTSTHDGVALAHATCLHLVSELRCLSLFVTHYPSLSELASLTHVDGSIGNFHMSFVEQSDEGNDHAIKFLYKLVRGAAARSYGLNVARLAGIPQEVLAVAGVKSAELERQVVLRSEAMSYISNFRVLASAIATGDYRSATAALRI